QLRQYLAAYHVRDQHEYRFSLTMFRLGLAEEILQQGNLRQSRDSRQALAVQVFQHTAEQVGFALAQADLMINFALANDGLGNTADIRLAGDGRNVHRDLQRHIAVGVHPRRDFNVYADVLVLKLGVDQRVDANAANAGLK